MRELFSEALFDEGYEITSVSDAQSVKGCFDSSRQEIVILDPYLKSFEGWDMLYEFKDEYPNLPVLIFTAYDSFKDDQRISQVDDYVVKSFSALDSLKQKIINLLADKTN